MSSVFYTSVNQITFIYSLGRVRIEAERPTNRNYHNIELAELEKREDELTLGSFRVKNEAQFLNNFLRSSRSLLCITCDI